MYFNDLNYWYNMRWSRGYGKITYILVIFLYCFQHSQAATVKDIFNLDPEKLVRIPRENKYYDGRYGGGSSLDTIDRTLKPEEAIDTPDPALSSSLGKRCTRCDTRYQDPRYSGYETRPRYGDRDYNRYDTDDRRYDDKRYDDRRYDDRRYYDRDRYDRYDRDKYYDRRYEPYDRYERERYERDPYDRYDRYSDRGIGYDNRGYDYRGVDGARDRDIPKPYDDYYRGLPGWEVSGRGTYNPNSRPESGYYGSGGGGGGGGGYATGWSYGGGRDEYRDRGYSGGSYRARDPYEGYRGTSYLYGRPSPSTTTGPSKAPSGTSDVTENPQQNNGSG